MRPALILSAFVAESSDIAPALLVLSGYSACSLCHALGRGVRRLAGPFLAASMAFSPTPALADDTAIPADWATVSAHAPLSHSDIIRQTALTAMFVVDAGQTIDGLARVHEGYHETNPLLQNRSPNAVRGYFAGVALGSYLITRSITPAYRPLFQYSLMGIEAVCIIRNRRFGLHYSSQF